jgi:hypothetical protein
VNLETDGDGIKVPAHHTLRTSTVGFVALKPQSVSLFIYLSWFVLRLGSKKKSRVSLTANFHVAGTANSNGKRAHTEPRRLHS